jgi:tetratricopeptide (TPR) repeat protein
VRGRKQPAWLDRLETEHGNLRAALAWALERGLAATAVGLAGALYPFWDLRGHYTEGRSWLARALTAEGEVPPVARVRALLGMATLAMIQGDLRQATAACEQALELSRRADDPAGFAHALQHLGFGALHRGELDLAATLLEESLRNARAADHRWLEGWSLVFLATEAVGRAGYERAARLAVESESVLRRVNDPEGLAWALSIRATATWRQGDRSAAVGSLRESMRSFQSLGGLWGLSLDLLIVGLFAGVRGDHERATALLGASEALRESIGAALLPFVKTWLDAAVTEARAALGGAFDRMWQSGRALSPDDAVAEAERELCLAHGTRDAP